jgi:hypothetical protein
MTNPAQIQALVSTILAMAIAAPIIGAFAMQLIFAAASTIESETGSAAAVIGGVLALVASLGYTGFSILQAI